MAEEAFEAHPNLLRDVIMRQAGTLQKGVLEGVMNGIDAGATRIDITLDELGRKLTISDNGKGFSSMEEIREVWKKFGTPHERDNEGQVCDAKFGEFRMGRGQLFAHGHNVWRTGIFKLEVDIKHKGLVFQPSVIKTPVRGCNIEVDLYSPIVSLRDRQYLESEIAKACGYVEVGVFFNGKQINTPPSQRKWTVETEDAYIHVKSAEYGRIEFYQQGVFVEEIPARTYGLSGTVVSKGRVKLNFARNQAMRDCPVYRRIIKKVAELGNKEITKKKKKDLTDSERAHVFDALTTREMNWYSSDIKRMPIFKDTDGGVWSVNQLRRLARTWHLQPDNTLGFSFARKGDNLADRVMQRELGIVFDEAILDWMPNVTSEAKVFEQLGCRDLDCLTYLPLAALAKALEGQQLRLLDVKNLTPTEQRVLMILNSYHCSGKVSAAVMHKAGLGGNAYRDIRTIRIGESEGHTHNGWTDGRTFIAIDRAFLAGAGTSYTGFVNILNLLIHEYCHIDESDMETSNHDEKFYKLFHDVVSAPATMEIAQSSFQQYKVLLENAGRRLPQRLQRDHESHAHVVALETAIKAADDAALSTSSPTK